VAGRLAALRAARAAGVDLWGYVAAQRHDGSPALSSTALMALSMAAQHDAAPA
jgi:hypothetical protein